MASRTPLLSIVIPTFQQGHYIEDCLNSVTTQLFEDYEVIIQDSESKDATQEVCERFAQKDPRFKYFREKDRGQSDGINRGLERSTGKYWTWICSDDYYYGYRSVQDLINRFEKSGIETVGVFGKAAYVDHNGEPLGMYKQFEKDVSQRDYKLHWPFSQPASILLRQRVLEVGRLKVEQNLGMDLDLFIRMLNGEKKFVYTPRLVASVRVQQESKSVKFERMTAENALAILDSYFPRDYKLKNSDYGQALIKSKQREKWVKGEVSRIRLSHTIPFDQIPGLKFLKNIQERAHRVLTADPYELSGGDRAFMHIWKGYQYLKGYCLKYLVAPVVDTFRRKGG